MKKQRLKLTRYGKISVYDAILNTLRANPTKWSNTLKQFVDKYSLSLVIIFKLFLNFSKSVNSFNSLVNPLQTNFQFL